MSFIWTLYFIPLIWFSDDRLFFSQLFYVQLHAFSMNQFMEFSNSMQTSFLLNSWCRARNQQNQSKRSWFLPIGKTLVIVVHGTLLDMLYVWLQQWIGISLRVRLHSVPKWKLESRGTRSGHGWSSLSTIAGRRLCLDNWARIRKNWTMIAWVFNWDVHGCNMSIDLFRTQTIGIKDHTLCLRMISFSHHFSNWEWSEQRIWTSGHPPLQQIMPHWREFLMVILQS